jgi:hypothetical protein
MRAPALSSAATLAVLFGACSGAPRPVADFEAFYRLAPYTVAVLPVANLSADADAPRYFVSTIGKPLIDRGYYVLPVQATAEILAAEGLTDGGQLLEVAPQRFAEYFGADAVLRTTLHSWDTAYAVLASSVTVSISYELLSTRTGEVLWRTDQQQTIQSGSGGGGLVGLIASAVQAAAVAATTDYVPMARDVNLAATATLPPGPYHPDFEKRRQQNLEAARREREQREAEAAGAERRPGG